MQTNKEWISIADLMAGLMMVFMFIAVVFMVSTEQEKKRMEDIALTYKTSRVELRVALEREFKDDLAEWGAEILPNSTIRFKEPKILFANNKARINQKFENILKDFFPRYIGILTSDEFQSEIDEIRIEGHTSSVWGRNIAQEEVYLRNAKLSQDRSLNVLRYVYLLPQVSGDRDWLTTVIRANGLSYAQRIFDENNVEDAARSRRVEFRVLTKSEEKIFKILGYSETV